MASLVADSIFSDVSNKVSGVFSSNKSESKAVVNGIDWDNKNFPHEKVAVFHVDPFNDKLSVSAIILVTRMKRILHLVAAAFVWNFISTIITVAGGARSGINILYSLLFALFGMPLLIGSFYIGYKAIAARLSDWKLRHLILQGTLDGVILLFVMIDGGNIHGFATIVSANQYPFSGGLIAMSILDSLVWLGVLIFSVFVLYKFYKYDVALKEGAPGAPAPAANAQPGTSSGASSAPPSDAAAARRAQKDQRMADKRAKLAADADPDLENAAPGK